MRTNEKSESEVKLQNADELFKELLDKIKHIKILEDRKESKQSEIRKKSTVSPDLKKLKENTITSLNEIISAKSSSLEEKAKAYWYSYMIDGITDLTLENDSLDEGSLNLAKGWLNSASELGYIPAIACQLRGIRNLKDAVPVSLETQFFERAYKQDIQNTLSALSQLRSKSSSSHAAWAISRHCFSVAKDQKAFEKGLAFFNESIKLEKSKPKPNNDLIFDRYFQLAEIYETSVIFKNLSESRKLYEGIYSNPNAKRKQKLLACKKLLSFYENGKDGLEKIDWQKIADYCEKIYDLSTEGKEEIIQKLLNYLTNASRYTAEERRFIKVHYRRIITQLLAERHFQQAEILLKKVIEDKSSQKIEQIFKEIYRHYTSSANNGYLRALAKLAYYSEHPLGDQRPSFSQVIDYCAHIIVLYLLKEYANLLKFEETNQETFKQAKQKLRFLAQKYKSEKEIHIGGRAARLYVLFFEDNHQEGANIKTLETFYPSLFDRKKPRYNLSLWEKLKLWQKNIDLPESVKKRISEKLNAINEREIKQFGIVEESKDDSAPSATDDIGIPEQSLPETMDSNTASTCYIVLTSPEEYPTFIENPKNLHLSNFRERAVLEINAVLSSKNIQLSALKKTLETTDASVKIEDMLEGFKTVKLNKLEKSCFARLEQIAKSESICIKHGYQDVNKFKQQALAICEREIANHQSGIFYNTLRKVKNKIFDKLRTEIATNGDTKTLEQSLLVLTVEDMEIINSGTLAQSPYEMDKIHTLAKNETTFLQDQQKEPKLSGTSFLSIEANTTYFPYQTEEFEQRSEQTWPSIVDRQSNESENTLIGGNYSPSLWTIISPVNPADPTPQDPPAQRLSNSAPIEDLSSVRESEQNQETPSGCNPS